MRCEAFCFGNSHGRSLVVFRAGGFVIVAAWILRPFGFSLCRSRLLTSTMDLVILLTRRTWFVFVFLQFGCMRLNGSWYVLICAATWSTVCSIVYGHCADGVSNGGFGAFESQRHVRLRQAAMRDSDLP